MPNLRVDSIFDVQKITTEAQSVETAITQSKESLVDLYNTIQKFKGTTFAGLATDTQKLTKAQSDAIKTANALAQQAEKLAKAQAAQNKALQEAEKLTQQQIKTTSAQSKEEERLEAIKNRKSKAINKELDEYGRLNYLYKLTQRSALNLGAALGAESADFKEASARAAELAKQLYALESATGQHNRNVGNYKSGFDGLTNSINQVTRELPAAAVSLQTLFLGLSNNFPILADNIAATRKEIAALRAAGEQTQSLGTRLANSFLSFNTVMTLGITLITIYGQALIEWIIGTSRNAAEATIELSNAIKATNDAVLQQNQLFAENQQVGVQFLKDRIALEEAQGASTNRLVKLRNDLAKAERAAAAEQLKNLGLTESRIEKIGGQYFSALRDLEAINQAARIASEKGEQKQVELLKKVAEAKQAEIDKLEPVYRKGIELLQQVSAAEAQQAEQSAENQTRLTKQTEKGLSDRRLLILNYQAKFNEDVAGSESFGENQRIISARKAMEQRLAIFAEERRRALSDINLTNAERLAVEEKYNQEYVQQVIKSQVEIARIRKFYRDQQEQGPAATPRTFDPEIEQNNIKITMDIVEKGYAAMAKVRETAFQKEQNDLRKQYDAGIISRREYEIQQRELVRRGSIEAVQASITALTELQKLATPGSTAFDNIASAIEKANAELAKLNSGLPRLGENAGPGLLRIKGFLEDVQKGISTASNLLSGALTASITAQRNEVQALENEQQKAYENEVQRITNSTLSEEEKANKLKILEDQRAAQRQENDREQRQLEIKRLQFEKAATIARLTIETALAVVHQLTSGDPFTATFRALAAGALGATQIGIAVATPIPQYAEGTGAHPGGLAVVGDGGEREWIKEPGKAGYWSSDRPTLLSLAKGASVTPESDIDTALYNSMLRNTAASLGEDRRLEKAIDKQTEALAKAYKKSRPVVHNHIKIDTAWGSYVNNNIKH